MPRELANGYNELTDANELAKRSQQDQQTRIKLKYDHVPTPSYLIAAMQQGLPKCAGIALGIDRLIMLASGQRHIENVIPFTIDRA